MARMPCITKEFENASWGTLMRHKVLIPGSLWKVLHVEVQKLCRSSRSRRLRVGACWGL
jgi:hypothetical protein